jgi:hypothetical protein
MSSLAIHPLKEYRRRRETTVMLPTHSSLRYEPVVLLKPSSLDLRLVEDPVNLYLVNLSLDDW